ncbi:MAG: hypothetical protein A2007_05295 [Verrucomicrobia bacterium GWC2_42_7]|nr:MAG: hypothetical protein A2007_05295 [Verrucomicrobia bacterium GWC2_42_7]
MKPQEKAEDSFLGLYCHVPFCPHRCAYCAFYHEPPKREWIDRYLDGIQKEVASITVHSLPKTIFFGGGTPGILSTKDFQSLSSSILSLSDGHKSLGTNRPVEWTVEMAPSTVKEDKLLLMKELGITRISLGIQSFNPHTLNTLGRRHSAKQALLAYELIREFAFDVNIDLMFAIPSQTLESWSSDLQKAIEIQPDHISTYCFTHEENTPFDLKLSPDKSLSKEESDLLFYEKTWDYLPENGFIHYEISNFARPGKQCLHNLNTWDMGEWIGIGPAAASQYNQTRYNNPASIEKWYESLSHQTPFENITPLTPESLATDALMFGLRKIQGVNLDSLSSRYAIDLRKKYAPLLHSLSENKLLIQEGPHIRLSRPGLLLSDSIALDFLE